MAKLFFFLLMLIGLQLFLTGSELNAHISTQPNTAVSNQSKQKLIPYTERFGFSKCVTDNGYIYWLRGDDQLLRVNRDDNKYPQALVDTNTRIGNFAVDGNNLYYISENKAEHWSGDVSYKSTGEVRKVDLGSGAMSTLLDGLKWPGVAFIGTDSTHIYFLEGSSGVDDGLVLLRLAKNGGKADRITSGLKLPNGFVVDEKNIYWSDYGNNSVRKIAKMGGEQIVLFDGNEYQAPPVTITSDQQYLYLLAQSGKIYQIDKEGGKGKTLYAESDNALNSGAPISTDKEFIFWPLRDRVMRLSKKGGDPTVVSLVESPGRCIVADDKYIYWNESHSGLLKFQK